MINSIGALDASGIKCKQGDSYKIKEKSNNCSLSPPGINLTKRESECFYLLSKGNTTTKKIAKTLGLSPRTIEAYINQIKIKMGLLYKSELIEEAILLMSKNLINRN